VRLLPRLLFLPALALPACGLRSSSRRCAAAAALLAAAGCATGGQLRPGAAAVRAEVETAKRAGAVRCAPRELALAQSSVDVAESELAYGYRARAEEHLRVAELNARRALELSRTCGPTQVTIRKDPPAGTVVIEKTDRDHDGLPDLEDRCPEAAGRRELSGCPDADDDGVADAEDACPKDPGPASARGCPVVAKDSDRDEIPDDIDRCPLDPEDKDGFQDEDGCPDADDDLDGIVDRVDACPNDPGPLERRGCPAPEQEGDRDRDGVPDRLDQCPEQPGSAPEGCPRKYALVEVKRERLVTRQQVRFASGTARVLPDSSELLGQLAQVLKDFPRMRLSIEAHTDATGTEAANQQLSQERAEAIRAQLRAKGVAADRLAAIGFGSTRPIASNGTARGREQNRRTEFRVVSAE
jgi:OmpA-OmpF porin, OOP family